MACKSPAAVSEHMGYVLHSRNDKTRLTNELSSVRAALKAAERSAESLQSEMVALQARANSYADEIKSVSACCIAWHASLWS